MRRKKLKNVLIATTAMALLTTSIPMNLPIQTAFAGGSGTGLVLSGGNGKTVDGDTLDAFDVGLRFSLVTNGGEVIKNANNTYYVDIWNTAFVPVYDHINTETRYNVSATKANITVCNTSALSKDINEFISNNGTSTIDFGTILNYNDDTTVFSGLGFNVRGVNFFNWIMDNEQATINGEKYRVFSVLMQYFYGNKILSKVDINNTFLVVEPVINLCNTGTNQNKLSGKQYISSWYGYIKHNIDSANDINPGHSYNIRDRLIRLGMGFELGMNDDTTDEMIGKIQNVLGVSIPQVSYTNENGTIGYRQLATTDYKYALYETGGSVFNFNNNNYKKYGYGMQAFWLKDLGIPPTPDPIDTYNTEKDPKEPYNPDEPIQTPDKENPTFDSTGTKTIIKTYIDLYQDEGNATQYTKVIDQGTYIQQGTSNRVVISDEHEVNSGDDYDYGYEIAAWYTSQTEFTSETAIDSLLGSSMLKTTSKSDEMHEAIGQNLFTITGYTGITGISNSNIQSYSNKPTKSFTSNSPQYTKTSALKERISKDENGDYNANEFITLDDSENTIVLLYVREHGWVDTTNPKGGTRRGTGSGGDGDEPDPHKPTPSNETGDLKIVKCYGEIDVNTYKIKNIKTETQENTSRNVHISSEPNYRLAEYVYSTRGNQDTNWDSVTAETWGTITDGTTDYSNAINSAEGNAFYMKGFVDAFSTNYGTGKGVYQSKYAWQDTETPITDESTLTTDPLTGLTFPGTYGTGLLSGRDNLNNYSQTIYFDMEDTINQSTQDDVLYLLFLLEEEANFEELIQESDGFVIPESFITRHNDFATNNITVSYGTSNTDFNSIETETTTHLFAQHKFQYTLPAVTGIPDDVDIDIEWDDPFIAASIEQTNTTPDSGIVDEWSQTEFIYYNAEEDKIEARLSQDNKYRLAYQTKQVTPGILSFSNANYTYVAYRKGDMPTLALL